MDSLVVPTLDTLRHWLDNMGVSFFECDTCQALHLPLDSVVALREGSARAERSSR